MTMEVDNEIAKQLEGNTLAMGAMAEILQKMDARFEKQEADESALETARRQQEEDEKDEEDYEKMIKHISDRVTKNVIKSVQVAKQETDNPMADLHGGGSKSVGGEDQWPMSGRTRVEDREENNSALDDQDTESVQTPLSAGPIEAMEKRKQVEKRRYSKMEKKEEWDDGDEVADVVGDEGAEEYPMDEEPGEDVDVNAMYKAMKAMQKELAENKANMEKTIQKETEKRLQKMGFREETGLVGPRAITKSTLGNDPDKKIVKAATSRDEVVDQLKDMSWGALLEMREKHSEGETNGLPDELKQY